ncbi:Hypothetical predicted protein [Paramuricea clavata]|uniref:Uncharacterized protein n=1 Tax=Paramuricea clavata TaxID=317549 RepID=A0A6S7KIR2_PARCT|nr:Hypothetical predicted protein [Paramuricea clavata]
MMQSTWEIEEAKAKLERAKKTRMELLQEARRSECAQGCNGDWLSCAEEILHNNGLSVEYFGEVVRDLFPKYNANRSSKLWENVSPQPSHTYFQHLLQPSFGHFRMDWGGNSRVYLSQ